MAIEGIHGHDRISRNGYDPAGRLRTINEVSASGGAGTTVATFTYGNAGPLWTAAGLRRPALPARQSRA